MCFGLLLHPMANRVPIPQDPVGAMGVLQLRRVLRAIGLPTIGTQQVVLAERLREGMRSGRLESFAAEARFTPAGPNHCGELSWAVAISGSL